MSIPSDDKPRSLPEERASESDLPGTEQAASGNAPKGDETDVVRSWSIERRDECLADHPVVKRRYTIPTPMVVHAHEESRDRVWTRRTGIVFYGEPRVGKTTCARSVMYLLREEFESIYITMASCRRSKTPREGLMSRLILEGSDHILAARSKPDDLFQTVISDLLTNVSHLGGDQFVLILDEVNLCNELDLTELLQIHNKLEMKGVKMTTISFGQSTVLNLISSLRISEEFQIIARFFRKPVPFLCCNSEETLAAVLQSLDEQTEWPEGSGCSYTNFFFPKAFRAGFRLHQYANPIWNALVTASPSRTWGFTMESITLTVNGIYIGKRGFDSAGMVLSPEDIDNALSSADI
ncbi:ATP-binding protein [Paraburkholderia sp. MM5477-R1]|uniref:ATP-binding protein n=1 Tax=Paraburkholderia sp. MM5477-R1 TaxID=2991062 RepID=UPI003D1DED2A